MIAGGASLAPRRWSFPAPQTVSRSSPAYLWTARIVEGYYMLAGEVERSPFADIPLPTRPYYRRRTWFLPAAAVLFRALDRIGR